MNSTNLVRDGQNNKMIYNFPNSVTFRNAQVAFAGVSMYYSWFNITNTLANNVFSYNWIDNTGIPVTYELTVPNGLYSIEQLNSFLQYSFIQNGHYLVNSAGNNVYYAEFLINSSRYAVQINTYLFPTALPVGWTNPTGLTFPPQSFNPIITLPPNINYILGYPEYFATAQNLNNTYTPPPSQYVSKLANGTLSYISTTAPNVQPNNSLIFTMSNINNEYAVPTSILYTLVPQVAAGEIINEKPPNFIWSPLYDGTYNQLRLQILGTDLTPIQINDPSITIILVIRQADDWMSTKV